VEIGVPTPLAGVLNSDVEAFNSDFGVPTQLAGVPNSDTEAFNVKIKVKIKDAAPLTFTF